MKIKVLKTVALLGVVGMLNLTMTGCGDDSVSAAEEESVETAGTGDDSGSGAEEEETHGDGQAGRNNGQADESETEENNTESDGPAAEADESGNEVAPSGAEAVAEGRWHVLAPEIAEIVDADFEGTVKKIDPDSFYITETQSEVMEDGSLLAIDASADAQAADFIQVVFEEDTRFYIRTIYEGGERYEDSEAAFEDLAQNMSVDLKGEFVGDVFHAYEVRMISVV